MILLRYLAMQILIRLIYQNFCSIISVLTVKFFYFYNEINNFDNLKIPRNINNAKERKKCPLLVLNPRPSVSMQLTVILAVGILVKVKAMHKGWSTLIQLKYRTRLAQLRLLLCIQSLTHWLNSWTNRSHSTCLHFRILYISWKSRVFTVISLPFTTIFYKKMRKQTI
jgi:hypothetical protein